MRLFFGLLLIFCLGIYAAEKHPTKVKAVKTAVRTMVIKVLS